MENGETFGLAKIAKRWGDSDSQFDLQIRAEKQPGCVVSVVLHQCFLWFWRVTPRLTAQICTVDTHQPLGADKWGKSPKDE